jgi:site-specific recombinase XerD
MELQRLLDHPDEQVAAARTGGRKGWLAAMRDSAAMKVAYAWGMRRRELVLLELADIGSNRRRRSSAPTASSASAGVRRRVAEHRAAGVC